jgi:hypothetical protein
MMKNLHKVSEDLAKGVQSYMEHILNNYNTFGRNCKFKNDLGFTVGTEIGNKYIRIFHWYEDGASLKQRACHSFVDLKTGDIWKAASWQAPAKNFPRGNVLTGDFKNIQWTGC